MSNFIKKFISSRIYIIYINMYMSGRICLQSTVYCECKKSAANDINFSVSQRVLFSI